MDPPTSVQRLFRGRSDELWMGVLERFDADPGNDLQSTREGEGLLLPGDSEQLIET